MNQVLNDKIRALPREEFYLLTCEKAVDLSLLIKSRYDLDQMQMGLLFDLTASLYLKELRLTDLYSEVKLKFGLSDIDAKRFTADLAGYKLLAIDRWLGENVIAYIQSLGVDAGDYRFEVEELKRLAAAELATNDLAEQQESALSESMTADSDNDDDAEFYQRFAVTDLATTEDLSSDQLNLPDTIQPEDILANQLEDLLTTDDNFEIEVFNQALIQAMVTDESLKNKLISLLANSSLIISAETIVLDGRQVPATVGNWIKSFINSKGSVMIDSVILSDFLVTATNARFLTEAEKLTLGRLLRLYSNIKFFPDSLQGDDPEQWTILPLSNSPSLELIPLSSTENVEIVETELKASVDKRVSELKQEAQKYPEGSLERMALEEEIKRIS